VASPLYARIGAQQMSLRQHITQRIIKRSRSIGINFEQEGIAGNFKIGLFF